jgi:hypothetical protein
MPRRKKAQFQVLVKQLIWGKVPQQAVPSVLGSNYLKRSSINKLLLAGLGWEQHKDNEPMPMHKPPQTKPHKELAE